MSGFHPQDCNGQPINLINFVPALNSLYDRVHFMDQFLSLVHPEYTQVKCMFGNVDGQRQRAPGFTSYMSAASHVFADNSGAQVLSGVPLNLMFSGGLLQREAELLNNNQNVNLSHGAGCCANGVTPSVEQTGSVPRTKMRKRKCLAKVSPVKVPTGKRRGRKRKYPLKDAENATVNFINNTENATVNFINNTENANTSFVNAPNTIEISPAISASTTSSSPSYMYGVEIEELVPQPTSFQVISESGEQDVDEQDQFTVSYGSSDGASSSPRQSETEMTCLDMLAAVSSAMRSQSQDEDYGERRNVTGSETLDEMDYREERNDAETEIADEVDYRQRSNSVETVTAEEEEDYGEGRSSIGTETIMGEMDHIEESSSIETGTADEVK